MLLAKNIFEFHARVQKCHFGKIKLEQLEFKLGKIIGI